MKILTITCHAVENHGACLQAYALSHYLRTLGHDAEIIDYRPQGLYGGYSLLSCPNRYRHPWLLKAFYITAKMPGRLLNLPRRKAFRKFVENYLHTTPECYFSFEQLRSNLPEADLYICGSDQIWNTYFYCGTDRGFYLDFSTIGKRKISYSASFGYSDIKQGYEDFVRQKINQLDSVSLREESGLKIAKGLGLRGELTVDSVFLLNRSHWESLADDNGTKDGKYVLVYDFEDNELIRYLATKYANLKGVKIYSIGARKLSYAHKNFNLSGPLKFLSLVKNADCIIGNSFHGILFSWIFERDFFVVRRDDGLNSRMEDLLKRYGLMHRAVVSHIDDNALLEQVDYDSFHEQLEKDIERSKKYLAEQINLAK